MGIIWSQQPTAYESMVNEGVLIMGDGYWICAKVRDVTDVLVLSLSCSLNSIVNFGLLHPPSLGFGHFWRAPLKVGTS
jgi:hypothetical protein